MVQANIALTSGYPAEAISHYNEVLYNLSPGHVCALLNRSMAYIESGYYELAVVDAYRASIAAGELRMVRLSFQDFQFEDLGLSREIILPLRLVS